MITIEKEMTMKIKFKLRSVYGVDHLYPACEVGKNFLKALDLKTFTPSAIKALKALGVTFEQVTDLVVAI